MSHPSEGCKNTEVEFSRSLAHYWLILTKEEGGCINEATHMAACATVNLVLDIIIFSILLRCDNRQTIRLRIAESLQLTTKLLLHFVARQLFGYQSIDLRINFLFHDYWIRYVLWWHIYPRISTMFVWDNLLRCWGGVMRWNICYFAKKQTFHTNIVRLSPSYADSFRVSLSDLFWRKQLLFMMTPSQSMYCNNLLRGAS